MKSDELVKLYLLLLMDLLCDTKADKNLNCEQLAQLYLKTACKAYYVSKGQGKGLLKS